MGGVEVDLRLGRLGEPSVAPADLDVALDDPELASFVVVNLGGPVDLGLTRVGGLDLERPQRESLPPVPRRGDPRPDRAGAVVTDDDGLTDSTSQNVTVSNTPPGGITIGVSPFKVKGVQHVEVTWSGATTAVDILREGVAVIESTPNDGVEVDNIGAKGGGSYNYQVCEAGTAVCSPVAVATF